MQVLRCLLPSRPGDRNPMVFSYDTPAAIFGIAPERRCGAPTAGIPTGIRTVST